MMQNERLYYEAVICCHAEHKQGSGQLKDAHWLILTTRTSRAHALI